MTRPAGLPAWSLFAALIAAAGLPIYIHAPKFYVDSYGVSLASLGVTLALLRLFDVVQDPILGWLAEAGRANRALWVALATAIMALSMLGLFAVTPPIAPLLWFALALTGLFSAFSFLTICFYAEGVAKAATLGPNGHIRLAGWREGGSLLGVSLAAVAPLALAGVTSTPFALFAALFTVLAIAATLAMRANWGRGTPLPTTNPLALFRPALSDPLARRLLLIALLNASPVAVTSTLFLFFVESRLAAPGLEGPLLLLFFLSAAASTPVWSRLAQTHGAKPTLLAAMTLAILAFLWTATLTTGDTLAFAIICAASGAALGADLTLLPAIFARRLAQIGQGGEAAAFGLWSFVSKLSLALAAATILPALDRAGFTPGAPNTESALFTLTLIYAVLPCVLKLTAITLLSRTSVPDPIEGTAQ
ncbi:MAG: MFS transporter [Tabrizicola sp.]|uniref:MFS transporter n=1 Tax=Tabrizicola sp. TaxID=2005166 RepID=UPI002736AFE5|nr:MFS transporter [Tabrizicola sp.]MDP3262226.1 MFS transporter [Tabrizicola sp.]MDP3648027.1 MFS transporter [Paracoccaceae bacterium]MDZ4068657.1 MFS transporter [Tabrizicola sp.]